MDIINNINNSILDENDPYYLKYLKYKAKYLLLVEQSGGKGKSGKGKGKGKSRNNSKKQSKQKRSKQKQKQKQKQKKEKKRKEDDGDDGGDGGDDDFEESDYTDSDEYDGSDYYSENDIDELNLLESEKNRFIDEFKEKIISKIDNTENEAELIKISKKILGEKTVKRILERELKNN